MNNWALFRFPNKEEIHLVIGGELIPSANPIIETLDNVYLFQSFHPNDESHYFKIEQHIANPDKGTLSTLNFEKKDIDGSSTTESSFKAYVDECIHQIQKENVQKVVPAKTKCIQNQLNDDDIIDTFYKACEQYPRAYVHLSSTDKFGTWLGATPEILLSINEKNVLETMALAGTQLTNGKTPGEAVWTQKEIEEQALVSRFIINCFKKIRLREFEEAGPKTVIAGNLMHLKTSFLIDLEEIDNPSLPSTLLELLHPTSAVCGLPKNEALSIIHQHESFDRKLYSGYTGPVNFLEETRLFVNLRCMEIGNTSIQLFAGAGVTEDSNPMKEWLETENKVNIMQSLIN